MMKKTISILTLLSLCGFLTVKAQDTRFSTVQDSHAAETKWTAEQLWNKSESQHLKLSSSNIVLDGNVLIEDDAAGLGSIRKGSWDTISAGVILKKRLKLEDRPVKNAIMAMLVYPVYPADPNSGGKILVSVNGHDPISYEVKHFWTSVPVPANYLKAGENIIQVTTSGKDVFRLPLALHSNYKVGSAKPVISKRSERSRDNGRTWTALETASAVRESAEYPIRLKLDSYVARGTLLTPVLNVGDKLAGDVLYYPSSLNYVKVKLDTLKTSGSDLKLRYRSGTSHLPSIGGWTAWKQASQSTLAVPADHRFVQMEISFGANDKNISPEISGLTVSSSWKKPLNTPKISLIQAGNNPLIGRSGFVHEDPSNAKLQQFHKDFRLDEVVEGSKSELEKIQRLRGWVAGKWDWYLSNAELEDLTVWDANQILSTKTLAGEPKKIGGNCLFYSIVLAQACQSFGIPARIVNTNYAVWGGHELVEVWSREYEKWIMMDPNFDSMFYNRENKVPLNILELHNVFLDTYYPGKEVVDRDSWTNEDRDRRAAKVDPKLMPLAMENGGHANSGKINDDYVWWKTQFYEPNPGYSGGYGIYNTAEVRWLPRSNWMSQQAPLPVTHGRTHWGWDGYLAWTDDQTPATPEHRNFVSKESDIYNRLFTVDFSAFPVSASSLKINMATESPGFKHYELIQNGKTITSIGPSVVWQLIPGINTLEIRSVDVLGNKGSMSSLKVDYKP